MVRATKRERIQYLLRRYIKCIRFYHPHVLSSNTIVTLIQVADQLRRGPRLVTYDNTHKAGTISLLVSLCLTIHSLSKEHMTLTPSPSSTWCPAMLIHCDGVCCCPVVVLLLTGVFLLWRHLPPLVTPLSTPQVRAFTFRIKSFIIHK